MPYYSIAKAVYLAVVCVIATVGIKRQLQMLQLNSYFASRYFGWLKENTKFIFSNVLFFLLSLISGAFIFFRLEAYHLLVRFVEPSKTVSAAYVLSGTAILIGTVLAAYIFAARACKKNRTAIKPLVVTARINRMFTAAAMISLIPAVLAFLLEGLYGFIAFAVLCLLTFAPSLLTLIVLLITSPIEKVVSKHYIKDAKKILDINKNLTVLGVTGSFGKTSTKFILKRILDEGFNVVATPGSFNTPMGVVRTVREHLRPESDVFICEMGAKKRGDIKEICDIANPQIGVITSVGAQHLETFGNIETVADTKFELADSANEVFLNFDNEIIRSRAANYNHTSYGTTPDCDVYADSISYGSFGASFNVMCGDECIPVITKLLGKHNVLNVTAGVAVAKRLGLSNAQIEYAVSRLTPTEHRLELKNFINGSLLIDDAYNANPEGSLEAVNVLASFEGRKKIIVTPGLVELGKDEYKYNYDLGLAAAEKCDIIILVGKERSVPLRNAAMDSKFDESKLFTVSAFSEAMELLRGMLDDKCVVLFENDLPDNYLK